MAKKEPKPIKRRLFNAYFISTLSITMVLFLVGLLGMLAINARYLDRYIRENIGFTLVLSEDVREVELMQLQKMLVAMPEVKSANYINSEEAAKKLKSELGEDFTEFLGYNPLRATIDLKLFAGFTQNDSITALEAKLMTFPNVQEVYYQRNMVTLINQNIAKISMILGGASLVMLLIFMALINNTIRLTVYSQRFIINTMQLVGATRKFIRRPLVWRSVYQGIIGALLANVLLFVLIMRYYKEFGEIINYNLWPVLGFNLGIVVLIGILLTWMSSFFAINKFLRMRFDELFY